MCFLLLLGETSSSSDTSLFGKGQPNFLKMSCRLSMPLNGNVYLPSVCSCRRILRLPLKVH